MVTLVIMDGFGERKTKRGNAIKLQKTPNINNLKKQFPHTTIFASGKYVGLSSGQMGNSEVGHLNLGAGRVVLQDLTRIDQSIKDKSFFKNEAIIKAIEHSKNNNSTLHIMGLCSSGGVHSHIDHLKALIDMVKKHNCKKVQLHLFLDGRDTYMASGKDFVMQIENYIAKSKIKIGSLCGRVYSMDREKRYDRVKQAYDMLTLPNAGVQSAQKALENSYKQNIFDEFFLPTKLKDFTPIADGDSVIYFNFRTDRARELTEAFTVESFDKFEHIHYKDLCFTTFTEYDATFKNVNVAFPPVKIEDNLSKIISDANLNQFHISETTKYAHVTFFFNGGIEKPYRGEERKLIESENVLSFASVPKMKAYEITNDTIKAIKSKKYAFVLVNLSNADMLGHTGNLNATIEAIGVVDECVKQIVDATLQVGGDCLVTADHGNAEEMIGKDGKVLTSHTTNKVPVILCSKKHSNVTLNSRGKLANIAPTVLKLLGLQIPNYMEKALFV